MVEPNELECVSCGVVLEDPDIFVKMYGNIFNCPKCDKPLTRIKD